MRRTSTTSHALLGLLGLRPSWTAAELAAQVSRNMRYFWPRAASRVFAELRTAEERGWATSSTETRTGPGAPTQTRYRLTAAGRRELRSWLATPPRSTVLECEAVLRMLLADLGSSDDLKRAIGVVGQDVEEIFATARVVGPEYVDGTAPFQDDVHVRALVFDFLHGFAMFTRDWSRRAQDYVDGWEGLDDEARARQGVDLIRRRLDSIPEPRESG
jgi:PadR family transcriptional regulator AphA